MTSLINYHGLEVPSATPGVGGAAISDNFQSLVDWHPLSQWAQSGNPTASNDNTQNYFPGSLWLNSSTNELFLCMSSATGAAVWEQVILASQANFLPLAGGTLNGALAVDADITTTGSIITAALSQDTSNSNLPLVVQSSDGTFAQLHGLSASSYNSNSFSTVALNGGQSGGYGQSICLFKLNGESCIKCAPTGSSQSDFGWQLYNFKTANSAIEVAGSTNYVGVGKSNPAYQLDVGGNIRVVAGYGLLIGAGANARLGKATLVAGTVTISNTTVTANTYVFLSRTTASGTVGELSSSVTAGSSLTITSTSNTDTSTLNWLLIEPG